MTEGALNLQHRQQALEEMANGEELDILVLGGNQGDAVTITRIAKSRCIARRWPPGRPVIGKPLIRPAATTPLSHDEA